MALTDMAQHGLIKKNNQNRFERWTHSKVLVNKLVVKFRKHPILTGRIMEITNYNITNENLVKHEIRSVEHKLQVHSSFMASGDDFKSPFGILL